jgi:hypothetical protein
MKKARRPAHAGEGSAFVLKNRRSRFLAALGMTGGGTFIAIGGPKAHVTLSMTGTLFHQPARLGSAGFSASASVGCIRHCGTTQGVTFPGTAAVTGLGVPATHGRTQEIKQNLKPQLLSPAPAQVPSARQAEGAVERATCPTIGSPYEGEGLSKR